MTFLVRIGSWGVCVPRIHLSMPGSRGWVEEVIDEAVPSGKAGVRETKNRTYHKVQLFFYYFCNYKIPFLNTMSRTLFLRLQSILLCLVLVCSVAMAHDPIRVACIGNSVTYGYGHRNPSRTSYPVCLSQMLGDGYQVRNFGHSGATLLYRGHRPYIRQQAWRDALSFAPDKAIIHLGLNDTDPRNWPNYRDEFVPNYLAMIDSLRQVNPDVEIGVCRMTPIFHGHSRFKSGTRDWHGQIQQAIEEVALLAGVHLIDLHEPLYHRPDLFADALHPDAEGAMILAHTVYSAITGNYGGLSLPAIYTNHMVIQRDKPFVVHGTANAGRKITATLGAEKRRTTVAGDGSWMLTFKAREATRKPLTLTVTDGDSVITLTDILVGEVWLCSGQSNMAFMLRQAANAQENIAAALGNPDLRIYDMRPRVYTDAVAWDSASLAALNRLHYFVPTQWQSLNESNAPHFSAIAYHFGAMLADSLDVPVGLICNAVGGAPIESFIDRRTLEYHPVLVDILTDWRRNDRIQDWVRSRGSYNIQRSTHPLQRHPYEPCYLYEAGIAPLAGYPLRGFVWYQGESNAHNVELFATEFPALVDSWRRTWGEEDMPFHFVQLSSIDRPSWPHFRDVQRQLAAEIAHCEMAVSSDKGDSLDVHPRDKRSIGERLGRIALYYDYGFTHVVPSGPAVTSAQANGKRLILTFDYACDMTSADGAPLRTFEVAGEYGPYYPADKVTVKGSTITLESAQVKQPTRARYGWQPFTRANLVNAQGLPASTFEVKVE